MCCWSVFGVISVDIKVNVETFYFQNYWSASVEREKGVHLKNMKAFPHRFKHVFFRWDPILVCFFVSLTPSRSAWKHNLSRSSYNIGAKKPKTQQSAIAILPHVGARNRLYISYMKGFRVVKNKERSAQIITSNGNQVKTRYGLYSVWWLQLGQTFVLAPYVRYVYNWSHLRCPTIGGIFETRKESFFLDARFDLIARMECNVLTSPAT